MQKTNSKTTEQYENQVHMISPHIDVSGKYINAKTPIFHKCNIHNVRWITLPTNILKGCGCPKCGNDKISDKNIKSYEEYINQLKKVNPNIICIGKYTNSTTKVLHKCLIDNYVWNVEPSQLLAGRGCPKCGGAMHITHEEYVNRVLLINPNIKVIGNYVRMRTPILHKCLKHGIEWITSPASVLMGSGCPECGKEIVGEKLRKTHEQYIEEVNNVNTEIKVIGKYINLKTKILHKCLNCGCEWDARPINILRGHGCPKCFGNIKKEHEEYVNEVSLINPNIEVIENYINARTPILHRCKIDNHLWLASPTSILH